MCICVLDICFEADLKNLMTRNSFFHKVIFKKIDLTLNNCDTFNQKWQKMKT